MVFDANPVRHSVVKANVFGVEFTKPPHLRPAIDTVKDHAGILSAISDWAYGAISPIRKGRKRDFAFLLSLSLVDCPPALRFEI